MFARFVRTMATGLSNVSQHDSASIVHTTSLNRSQMVLSTVPLDCPSNQHYKYLQSLNSNANSFPLKLHDIRGQPTVMKQISTNSKLHGTHGQPMAMDRIYKLQTSRYTWTAHDHEFLSTLHLARQISPPTISYPRIPSTRLSKSHLPQSPIPNITARPGPTNLTSHNLLSLTTATQSSTSHFHTSYPQLSGTAEFSHQIRRMACRDLQRVFAQCDLAMDVYIRSRLCQH